MRLEKLNVSNSKGKLKIAFASGCLITITLIVLVNFIASKALYRKTESVKLATGTVNYSLADLNIIAMYKEKDTYNTEEDKYESIEEIPTKGYALNKEKSICKVADKKDEKISIGYIANEVNISHLTKKGTKCYLYFDITSADKTLSNLGLESNGTLGDFITGPSCTNGCGDSISLNMNQNGLYETVDDDGKSYIFRGTVSNNWLKFGQTNDGQSIWWRIIRINGDGTIRLIYAGKGNSAPSSNGTNVLNSQAYNTSRDDNTYEGYYYGTKGESDFSVTHSNTTQSDIARVTENWFTGTNLDEPAQLKHIDENAGFCNNRQISQTAKEWWTSEATSGVRGTNKIITAYKGFYKAFDTSSGGSWRKTEQYPDLRCSSSPDNFESNADYQRDYYTWKEHASRGNKALNYPIGQITMDEVILAGGFGGRNNTSYWLYTGQAYWTISPTRFDGDAGMFTVNDNGLLDNYYVSSTTSGVRPVINLKPDNVTLQNPDGDNKGTTSNPYLVSD